MVLSVCCSESLQPFRIWLCLLWLFSAAFESTVFSSDMVEEPCGPFPPTCLVPFPSSSHPSLLHGPLSLKPENVVEGAVSTV